ncbi:hypothetical protein SAMN05428970_3540 [Agromyces sp. CF514]|uniref:hypothetical protein n=1 Tax=Agromyces sp. CF514 TaxID=1881031 RepID=UPI0008E53904|nr:hypothetical protein [Agromyces sp. CF514]SFR88205.1 hypothetical protein SAMN05428970_3540 [Agromyces sp. CF514]
MPAPRSKSLFAWEPLPYLVVLVLLILTGLVRPSSPTWLFWPFTLLLVAAIAWLAVGFVQQGRDRSNPDRWGELATLDGLEIIDAPGRAREVRSVIAVADVHRHQAAIDLARIHGGADQHAVLVPRASRWLSKRYRVGVQLVGGDRPRHAGFLSDASAEPWLDRLDALRLDGAFVRVPARITGDARPFGVDLDASGLAEALASSRA